MQHLTEGTTPFAAESEEKITRSMPVFYNPVMKLNRDLSLLALATLKNPRIALPMEASGIRAARILNELKDWKPSEMLVNDISERALETAKRNIVAVQGDFPNVKYSALDASIFLRQSGRFDYVDIDPFGTPNPFLDAAVQSLKRGGILAATATDTSALAGTYPRATQRKYWAMPSRTWAMHDLGLRILIRKVQLVAAQYTVALTPILSIATDHYYRVFFRASGGANAVKPIVADHRYAHIDRETMQISVSYESTGTDVAGPLWTGPLHDKDFVGKSREVAQLLGDHFAQAYDLLEIVADECRLPIVGFTDLHELASRLKIMAPKRDHILRLLGEHGCRTHITGRGIKTDLPFEKLKTLLH